MSKAPIAVALDAPDLATARQWARAVAPTLNTEMRGAPVGPAKATAKSCPLASSATPARIAPVKPAKGTPAIPAVAESTITP